MRTTESRDLMVARVKAAFEQKPTFEAWPTVAAKDVDMTSVLRAVVDVPITQATYLAALHEICALGEPVGRTDVMLVGRRIAEAVPQPHGKRIAAGRGRSA